MLGKTFHNQSIKFKLILIITLVAACVSASIIGVYFYHDSNTFLENQKRRAKVVAEIIGSNSIASLTFRDRKDAMEVLGSLSAERAIRSAYLFSQEGGLLAEYLREGEIFEVPVVGSEDAGDNFGTDSYSLVHPIKFNEKTIGSLYILWDLQIFRERFRFRVRLGMIVGAVSILIALLLATWLQKVIVDPMRSLGEIIDRVRESGDYSLEAKIIAKDELGKITDGFNRMLFEISRRDQQLALQMKMLEESNRELDHRVEERTAELKAINKELESFSYSVSHDLRAPLRSVQGFSQIVLDEYGPKLDSEGQRLLGIISSDVIKMGCLVDDLLSFSRMGRQQMVAGAIDMKKLVGQVYEELKAAHPDRKITLHLADIPPAAGDSAMVRQVIFNLFSNAIKFSSVREESVINFSAHEKDDFNVYTIEDNGVGFDMRYKNKLFGIFSRLHSEEEFEGTGVGLAIVHKVVQRHGGTVDAESELGKGAKFHFSLPKLQEELTH